MKKARTSLFVLWLTGRLFAWKLLPAQIYAAADFILVPSIFEPCGLTQLTALRYGAIPIVRQTGGECFFARFLCLKRQRLSSFRQFFGGIVKQMTWFWSELTPGFGLQDCMTPFLMLITTKTVHPHKDPAPMASALQPPMPLVLTMRWTGLLFILNELLKDGLYWDRTVKDSLFSVIFLLLFSLFMFCLFAVLFPFPDVWLFGVRLCEFI